MEGKLHVLYGRGCILHTRAEAAAFNAYLCDCIVNSEAI